MRKYLIVISEERGYAKRLCEYLSSRSLLPLTPVPFEEPEEAAEFCMTHPAAVILADETAAAQGRLSGISERAARLLLTEERGTSCDRQFLYRYSGVEEIIHRIMDVLECDAGATASKSSGKSIRLVTVYSPSLPSVKTAFALTLAAMEKRIRKTLYLNLEEFGGTGVLLAGGGEKTLSDALYYLRQDALDSMKLSSMLNTGGSIDYIPPMLFADDVKEAAGEDWVRLINRISEISEYEEIIVDLPQSLYVGQDLIDVCDELYIPMGGDSISEARMLELEQYMERPEHRHMLEKARRIHLSGTTLPPAENSPDYPEELMYGKFGEEMIREVNAGKNREKE